MVVVIQMPGRSFVFGKSLYGRAVGKKNIGPPIVIVVENNGAVAGCFDNELFVSIAAVHVQRVQSGLPGNFFEANRTRLYSCGLRFGGTCCLGREEDSLQRNNCEKQSESGSLDGRQRDHHHSLEQNISNPRCSIPNSTTSPAFKYCGGFMPNATPAGVPVLMTSPGSNVMNWLT